MTVGQRRAVDELEHERRSAARRFLEAVDRGDVRMIQRGEDLRLALEPRERDRDRRRRLRQDLHRDVAAELRVACAIHLAHATGAEQRDDS